MIFPPKLLRGLLFGILVISISVSCSNDYAKKSPPTTTAVPAPIISAQPSATKLVNSLQKETPPPTSSVPTPSKNTSPSPTNTPVPVVRVSVPDIWSDAVNRAIQLLDSQTNDWLWQRVEDSLSSDIHFVKGESDLILGQRPLALTVPFSTAWESISGPDAEGIMDQGHPIVISYDWAEMPNDRRALRVDGMMPFDSSYPIQETWSLAAAPGYESAGMVLAQALRSVGPSNPFIHLAAVGDLMLDPALGYANSQGNIDYPFAEVSEALSSADITVGNLESSLGDVGLPAQKSYTFQAPPAAAKSLAGAGIDVLSLANNHAMDFGPDALLQGIDLLQQSGIAVIGAGEDANAARTPHIIDVNGIRLAFLAYVDVPVEVSGFDTRVWSATADNPGLAWANPDHIAADVSNAGENADVVIVLLHSGYEYVKAPSLDQVNAAKSAIDAGASLVVGHHAHVLQGVSFYNGGVIVYGLGNFAFEIDGDPQTAILNVWLDKDGVRQLEFTPAIVQFGGQPRLANQNEAANIRTEIYRSSDSLNGQ
jgi:poly-gamma-glutamate synthesis protein (capsule biosynthesis protein)